MGRPAVTVVVAPVADPATTSRCIDRLRSTLGTRDAVVALVAAGAPAPAGLSPAVRVVELARDESLEAAVVRVATTSTTPLLAELHADVAVTAQWLDRLARALDDPSVAQAGPRSNLAPPGQFVPDATYADARGLREFVRSWRANSSGVMVVDGEVSAFARVRRTAQVAAGSPPRPLRSAVVHGVYVHHEAVAGCPDTAVVAADEAAAPLVSASLIVKDEEAVIASCIEAAQRFADEVVVYDTGSSDRTREIATGLGATVVEGFWDDDFGAARNRSLAHCTGRWILVVDADEIAEGDPRQFRDMLRADTTEGYLVTIHNLTMGAGVGAVVDSVSLRLFRRAVGQWQGRLHEQAVHRRLGRALVHGTTPHLAIRHSGYLPEVYEAKGKSDRNLELARRAAGDATSGVRGDLGDAVAAVNLARSVHAAGDREKALELFDEAWKLPLNPRLRRQTSAGAFEAAAALGRFDRAAAWLDRLEEAGEIAPVVTAYRARLLATRGEAQASVDLFQTLPATAADADGVTFDRTSVAAVHASMLSRLGRDGDACEVAFDALRSGVSEVPLSMLLRLVRDAGLGPDDLVPQVHPRLRRAFLAQCLQIEPSDGDLVLTCFWRLSPDTDVLATASSLAPRLDVLPALEWAVRLRGRGLAAACPLVAIAADTGRTARDRVLAAAVVVESFADASGFPLLEDALAAVTVAESAAVLAELAVLAPDLARAVEPAPSSVGA